MKKLGILLLAFTLLCSCFMLAACGDGDDNSSAADSSSAADASSTQGTSSTQETSSTATSSEETSSEVPQTPDESSEDTTSDEPVAATETPLWVTHYNTLANEGAGVILSSGYSGGNWWFHISFKPVEGQEGVYEVVDINDGLASAGGGSPLEIPKGGFVYALNAGNDYPGTGDTSRPDYTTKACSDSLEAARSWKKGDKLTFSGIDFENFTEVPTTTPDVNWYEDGDYDYREYVCTATFTKVG